MNSMSVKIRMISVWNANNLITNIFQELTAFVSKDIILRNQIIFVMIVTPHVWSAKVKLNVLNVIKNKIENLIWLIRNAFAKKILMNKSDNAFHVKNKIVHLVIKTNVCNVYKT